MNKDQKDNVSQSSEIIEEKENLRGKEMDELSSSSDNYDIPTTKNDSVNSSESEATLINEKNHC